MKVSKGNWFSSNGREKSAVEISLNKCFKNSFRTSQ